MKSKGNRFERGSGVYKCTCCGRNTRSTGRGDNENVQLCSECYELAGHDNELTDTGETSKETVRAYFEKLTSHGIDPTILFPNLQTYIETKESTNMTTSTLTKETIDKMSRKDLRLTAKVAGIKYGKLSVMQIREALLNAPDVVTEKPTKSAKKKIATKKETKVRKERTGTKMEAAMEIMQENDGKSRKEIIALFMSKAKLTKAGAATYYALCKKKM
jgi:hypothetical protein